MRLDAVRITKATRRDIIDAMLLEGFVWHGRLTDNEFLNRVIDLTALPSTDPRFQDADGDIWQHRVNNHDWDDAWVFSDPRINIIEADDDRFLKFLCETVHPIVRSDSAEVNKLVSLYNEHLERDGYRLVERKRLSGKQVYAGRLIAVVSDPPAVSGIGISIGGCA